MQGAQARCVRDVQRMRDQGVQVRLREREDEAPRGRGRPVRVLLAIDKLGYETAMLHGAGRAILEWNAAFDPARVEVTTCVMRDVSGVHQRLGADGDHVLFFRTHAGNKYDPALLWKFVQLIRRRRIDVLHLQGYTASIFGRIAGLLTGTPSIVHVHANYARSTVYPRYVQLLDHALARGTAKAVAISRAVRDFCVETMGFRPEQVEVVPLPMPRASAREVPPEGVAALRERYGLAAATPVVGAITRFYPEKATEILVEAFADVARRVPAARLLLVGDGPQRADLEARVRELGLTGRVVFAGFQSTPELHVRLFSVTAVPSREEGLGMTAIESLAAGVPVVATRVGGLPEVVADGRSGLLVPPDDAPALADALVRVLADQGLRERLALGARAESRRFAIDRFVNHMEGLYRSVARYDRRHRQRRLLHPPLVQEPRH